MRLVCPSCDAQYEVDASAIPETGRDVQCSNCGNAWFQGPEVIDEDTALYGAPDLQAEAEADEKVLAEAMAQNVTPPAAFAAADDDDDTGPEEDPAPPPPNLPKQRSLDDSVLAVLREEAEREAAARRSDASTLEMQGDLGLPPPVSAAVGGGAAAMAARTQTEQRAAPIRGEPEAPTKPIARRDLLPDIEEINSTLSPSTAPNYQMADDDDLPDLMGGSRQKSGFRSGFVLMLLVAGLGAALYIMAPQISQQIPGAADAMTTYVGAVDAARVWLDGMIRSATGALNGFTGNQG